MTPKPDNDPRAFTLTRVYDAPRDLVYKVWTDPRYVALWWGIEGSTIPRCELDVRPGGRLRIDMRTPDGTVYPNHGEYVEVVENRRIVSRDIADPTSPAWASGSPPEPTVSTVTFADAPGGGTEVSLTIRAASPEDCAMLLQRGMREGIGQSLVRLERLLAQVAAGADPVA